MFHPFIHGVTSVPPALFIGIFFAFFFFTSTSHLFHLTDTSYLSICPLSHSPLQWAKQCKWVSKWPEAPSAHPEPQLRAAAAPPGHPLISRTHSHPLTSLLSLSHHPPPLLFSPLLSFPSVPPPFILTIQAYLPLFLFLFPPPPHHLFSSTFSSSFLIPSILCNFFEVMQYLWLLMLRQWTGITGVHQRLNAQGRRLPSFFLTNSTFTVQTRSASQKGKMVENA